ncbi:MAG TPA: hypothetical protein P5186_14115 [Candidatus Paceibacterota bacterium]|nr:hypothetical protein [Verrucomicrobiota bacterium]HRY49180.1 hypothetical protein [Candidatus Paceibacterota bacterium]HSA02404.1 hypothetical protein [Candidatus Paceibacterota bacterium]
MNKNQLSESLGVIALAGTAITAAGGDEAATAKFIADLKSADDKTRAEALDKSARFGASVVPALADLLGSAETEHRRAAQRALYRLVRHAGRPGAESEARSVEVELVKALNSNRPAQARRELLWMTSEIGKDLAIDTVASLLGSSELREDARCVLQRIPGDKSLEILKTAYEAARDDFKKNLAESLVKRGVTIPGFQSEKLKPVKD